MRCPGCNGITTNVVKRNRKDEAGFCDQCYAEIMQLNAEYGEHLASLPILREAVKTATYVKNAMHQWNAKQ